MLKALIAIGCLAVGSTALWAAEPISVSGCLGTSVEGCLLLKSPGGNYTLYVTEPRPSPGRGVTVTGVISDLPNFCMAGRGIAVEKWNYNRLRCPK